MVTAPAPKQLTPAMAQWHRWKNEHPHELLFFRMGDFYELFFEDAKAASAALGLALTSRSKGEDAVPMAGVPVRSVDHYLKKLVRHGFRVAICEQMEDPKEAEGVVERAVVRIVTAGTLTEEDLLERGQPNFLAAVHVDLRGAARCGLAFADLSTGAFVVEEVGLDEALDALERRDPAEVLVSEALDDACDDPNAGAVRFARALGAAGRRYSLTRRPPWQFDAQSAQQALFEHFRVGTLEGFGLQVDSPAAVSAGVALRYLAETQRTALDHLDPPRLEDQGARLVLDRATRSCLELTESAREGRREGTLLWALDRTVTAMGARELREWILAPLRDVGAIRDRQAAVGELLGDGSLRARIAVALKQIADLERLLTRVVTNRANARDLVHLRTSLDQVPELRRMLSLCNASLLSSIEGRLDPLPELVARLQRALVDDPPLALKEGGLIRDGYHAELDELRAIRSDGRDFIRRYQADEAARTGISNLRVGFNRVFGFYIEITNSQKERVPAAYTRKQTLKNAERFITPELKEYEGKVLHSEERAHELEHALFMELRDAVAAAVEPLKRTARAIAELDVLRSLAEVAATHGCTRPEVDDGAAIEVEEGRHPVLLATMGASRFVPNDVRLEGGDGAARRLAIVTGPNMAGKSTYIRQVALLQILAQVGAFVPAKKARIGVADRVFARVGASDDLARGSSTFMVEMTETANILNNATERSLVVLDEVGRGTSTFDGLAIAWAISEHLLAKVRCRALFATHYHQLIGLAEAHGGVVNLNVAVKEWGEEIVFMHRIVEGGTDRSYGIHVARLAGVPRAVLARAAAILDRLEKDSPDLRRGAAARAHQPTLFDASAPPPDPRTLRARRLLEQLDALDLDRMAPFDALLELRKWKEEAQRRS